MDEFCGLVVMPTRKKSQTDANIIDDVSRARLASNLVLKLHRNNLAHFLG